jgi:hypothetical protein
MQTLSDSADSASERGGSQDLTYRAGESTVSIAEQFGSGNVFRNTFLYGDARIQVGQNLRVKTAEYQHKPENRVR